MLCYKAIVHIKKVLCNLISKVCVNRKQNLYKRATGKMKSRALNWLIQILTCWELMQWSDADIDVYVLQSEKWKLLPSSTESLPTAAPFQMRSFWSKNSEHFLAFILLTGEKSLKNSFASKCIGDQFYSSWIKWWQDFKILWWCLRKGMGKEEAIEVFSRIKKYSHRLGY